MKIDVQAIYNNSKRDGLDSTAALLKIGEEQGELFSAHLNKLDLANKSASSEPNTLEEGVDLLMCDVDYLFKEGYTIEQINEEIQKKCIKWESKIIRNAELTIAKQKADDCNCGQRWCPVCQ